MKKRKFIKSLFYRLKKIPSKLRIILVVLGILVTTSIPFSFFLKKHPKQYKPEFKTQLWGDWDYTLTSPQGNLITSLGTDDNNAIMKVERNGGSVTITSPLNKANIEKEDDYVIYKTENELINIKYQPLEEGIKEEIILYDDPYQAEFVSKISLANVEPRVTSDGQIVFVNQEEEYQFHIESPFAQDTTGDITYNLKYRILEIEDNNADPEKLKKQSSAHEESYLENYLDQNEQNHVKQELFGGIDEIQKAINANKEYYLVLEIDAEWIQDPNRQYPIIIDPTIVHDESSEFAGQFNGVTDTGSGSSPSLETYYQEAAADAHTVGLWHLNESADNSCTGGEDICDSSGNDNDATITGSASIIDGILNNGRYLNGDDSFATSSNYNFTNEDFTVEMWINPKDLSNTPILFSNGVYNGSGYYMHMVADPNGGYVHFYTNQAGAHQVSYSYLGYSLNEWHHLAIVRTGPNVAIYCDGEDITYVTGNHVDPASTSHPFTVGTYSPAPAAYYFDGDIDEVRVSNVARTPEEIKAAASRKPSAVYTSEVIETTSPLAWDSLSWDELVVSPGDGETIYDSTDLIAQWNFNETSGTTADNAAGSCGATCDGILYGMTTTGQDDSINSGWTNNNRRWGTGALMFDNTDDYVYIGNLSITDGADDLTVEGWVYSESSDANHHRLFSENGILYVGQYSDQVSIYMGDTDGSAWSHYSVSMGKLSVGQWHHVVWVKDGTSAYVYIDGVQTGTMDAPATLGTSGGGNYLGGSATTQMWDGTIDSVRMYSRALSADEILANYNSSNIEFQTRTGSDSSPDDGDWSNWAPVTAESLVDSFNNGSTAWSYRKAITISHTGTAVTEYQVMVNDIDTASMISAGKLQSDCDDLRFTNSDGELIDYYIVGDTCNSSDTKIWVKVDSIPASGGATIYMFYGNPFANAYSNELNTFSYSEEKPVAYILHSDVDDLEIISLMDNNSISHNGTTINLNKYEINTGTGFGGGSISQFLPITAKGPFNGDDSSDDTDTLVPISWAGTEFMTNVRYTSPSNFHMIAPWVNATVNIYYGGVLTCSNLTVTSSGNTHSCSGTGVLRIESTTPILVFHDPGGDENPLLPTTASQMIGGGNGSNMYANASGASYEYTYNTNSGSHVTGSLAADTALGLSGVSSYGVGGVLAWSNSNPISVMQIADGDGGDSHSFQLVNEMGTTWGSAASSTDYISVASTQATTCNIYRVSNDSLVGSGTATSSNSDVYYIGFGTGDSNAYLAEPWYMECNKPAAVHFQKATASESGLWTMAMNRQFTYPTPSVGSLGSESTLASHSGNWITPNADTPSTAIELTTDFNTYLEGSESKKISTGEYKSKERNTILHFSLDETNGDLAGDDVFDESNNGNNGEFNGSNISTAVVSGIKGNARVFNGSDDYIDAGNDASITTSLSNSPFTFGAWIKASSSGTIQRIIDNDYVENSFFFGINTDDTAILQIWDGTAWGVVTGSTIITNDAWHHIIGTYDGNTIKIYVDGNLEGEEPLSQTSFYANNVIIGCKGQDLPTVTQPVNGILDEVNILNTALTAEEIAEEYRLGRDHYINQTITSTDLSDDNKLPFYVAADRPGTYLETLVGESEYANYQTDEYTAGLWHLDEGKNMNDSVIKFNSTNVAGASYSYYKVIDGKGVSLATGDTFEYDVYMENALDDMGGIDLKFTDSSYARDVSGWTDDLGITCHPGGDLSSYAYNQWHHRICNVPSGLNGKTIDFVDLVNEVDTATAITAYYDNFTVKNSSGTVKGHLYVGGTPEYDTLDFEHNGSNTQSISTGNYTSFGLNYVDQPMDAAIKDSSGNGNDGTSYFSQIDTGKIGNSRKFDEGNNENIEHISIPDSSSLDLTTAYTLEAWIYPQGDGWRAIVNKGGFSSSYAMMLNTTNIRCYTNNTNNLDSISIIPNNQWTHVACVWDGTNKYVYVNGKLDNQGSWSGTLNNVSYPLTIGRDVPSNAYTFEGNIDEVRVSNSARSADEIRQAYEVGSRSHPITIDFAASGDSGNLISNSSDYSFTIDATKYGLDQKGSNLYLGEKIIAHEKYSNTEYFAQGTVTAVNESTGAVTVSSWDAGSTFPASGYTANANFFKWQREYWDINNIAIDEHMDAITQLTLRITNGNEGRTVWLDDLRSSSNYLTNSSGSTITSPLNDYFQYRAIFSSSDENVSATLESVTLDYITNASPGEPTSLLTEGQTNPVAVMDTTPEFSAIYNDADTGDIANKYQIQVDNNSDFSSPFWDSGSAGTGMSDCTEGNRCNDISYAGSSLSAGTTYYWRIRYWDDDDDLGPWSTGTNTFSVNGPPNTPSLDSPIDTVINQSRTPSLLTTSTEPNSEYVRYKIELCENEAMTTSCQTFDQTSSQTGWSGQDTQSNTAYTSGTQATYTLQSNLDFNKTYYWRSYAIDPSGTDTWSTTQATPYSFTTLENQTPIIPTLDLPIDEADNQSIYLSLLTTSTDADSDYIRYKIELCENEAMTTSCQTFDQTSSQTGWSGQDTQSNTAYTSGTQATYTVYVALESETTYYWRSYAIDPAGSNVWSATQVTPYSFTTLPVPDAPAPCTISRNPLNNDIAIQWEDNNLFKDSYTLQKKTNNGSFIDLYTSIPITTYDYLDTNISTGNSYQYRVATIYEGISSAWCTTSKLSIGLGDFFLEGVNLSGIKIN